MALELRTITVNRVVKTDCETFAVPAGKHLKIELTPDGEELLDYEAPAEGASATIQITVRETGV